jgi:hypothetical protein
MNSSTLIIFRLKCNASQSEIRKVKNGSSECLQTGSNFIKLPQSVLFLGLLVIWIQSFHTFTQKIINMQLRSVYEISEIGYDQLFKISRINYEKILPNYFNAHLKSKLSQILFPKHFYEC